VKTHDRDNRLVACSAAGKQPRFFSRAPLRLRLPAQPTPDSVTDGAQQGGEQVSKRRAGSNGRLATHLPSDRVGVSAAQSLTNKRLTGRFARLKGQLRWGVQP
jgi:hypothetical protein